MYVIIFSLLEKSQPLAGQSMAIAIGAAHSVLAKYYSASVSPVYVAAMLLDPNLKSAKLEQMEFDIHHPEAIDDAKAYINSLIPESTVEEKKDSRNEWENPLMKMIYSCSRDDGNNELESYLSSPPSQNVEPLQYWKTFRPNTPDCPKWPQDSCQSQAAV
jgi:hypothetical protein